MGHKILTLLIIIFSATCFGQQLKVLLTEQKIGKRVTLIAENRTLDTLNVFLTVNAEGYRRSAWKPVVKNVLPKTTVSMITLIELDGVDSRYTYDMVVNDYKHIDTVSVDSPEQDIERILTGKLVVFTIDECIKCESLKDELDSQHIQHRFFNIKKDAVLYGQFMSYIERRLTLETVIRFPIIWNKNDVIFGYDNLEEVVQLLN